MSDYNCPHIGHIVDNYCAFQDKICAGNCYDVDKKEVRKNKMTSEEEKLLIWLVNEYICGNDIKVTLGKLEDIKSKILKEK